MACQRCDLCIHHDAILVSMEAFEKDFTLELADVWKRYIPFHSLITCSIF
jgi:hypothetical protein